MRPSGGTFGVGERSSGMGRLARLAVVVLLIAACGDRLTSGVGAPGSPTAEPVASATSISATIRPVTPAPSGAPSPTPVVTPVPTPSPTITPAASGALTLAQLKYRVID